MQLVEQIQKAQTVDELLAVLARFNPAQLSAQLSIDSDAFAEMFRSAETTRDDQPRLVVLKLLVYFTVLSDEQIEELSTDGIFGESSVTLITATLALTGTVIRIAPDYLEHLNAFMELLD